MYVKLNLNGGLLNFFDLKPLNTSKRPLNASPTFFRDTRYENPFVDLFPLLGIDINISKGN